MRISCVLLSILALLGVCSAQPEMQFPEGPTYLLTQGSALFARPVVPPTLNIQSPLVPFPTPVDVSATEEEFLRSLPPLPPPDLFPMFYGVPEYGEYEYGPPEESEIYVSFREPEEQQAWMGKLPMSIVTSGVSEFTTASALKFRGYGITLPEAASYWKTHEERAAHVYTNADIERLHNRQ